MVSFCKVIYYIAHSFSTSRLHYFPHFIQQKMKNEKWFPSKIFFCEFCEIFQIICSLDNRSYTCKSNSRNERSNIHTSFFRPFFLASSPPVAPKPIFLASPVYQILRSSIQRPTIKRSNTQKPNIEKK